MKSPILFEEAPPTALGSVLGLGIGVVSVVIGYGLGSEASNALCIAMASMAILLVSFWTMRKEWWFWMPPLVVSILYIYLVDHSYLRARGSMGYEIYPQIVILSLIQVSMMYVGGVIIRHYNFEK